MSNEDGLILLLIFEFCCGLLVGLLALSVHKLPNEERYKKALEEILEADKGLLSNHQSWEWAMNELTDEVSESLGRIFSTIGKARKLLKEVNDV